MRFLTARHCLCISVITSLLLGCADSNFLDRTKIDGSILMGDVVEVNDPIAQRTVLIAQNFEINDGLVQYFGLCTGVVLNPTTILTAAHCTKNFESSKIITTTNAHSQKILKSQIYNIKKTIIHDEYVKSEKANKSDYRFDIALLKTDHPMTDVDFDNKYLISASTEKYFESKNLNFSKYIIAGYGRNTSPQNPLEKRILMNGILEKANIELTAVQLKNWSIMIDQNKKSGVCSGDSGGPLFVNRNSRLYLQGLAVAVINTNKTLANRTGFSDCNGQGVFLNLDFHKEWIRQALSTTPN